MQVDRIQMTDVRYNPESSGFEAIVRVHDHGESLDYPVYMRAPLHADFNVIARGLRDKARRVHKTGTAGLRLRKADAPATFHGGPASHTPHDTAA